MKVAGFGFRSTAGVAALREALEAAGGSDGIKVLAALVAKADAEPIQALGRALQVPVLAIAEERLAGMETPTVSPRIMASYGTGSIAEALALIAAGPGARLIACRTTSCDGAATAAIAEGSDQ